MDAIARTALLASALATASLASAPVCATPAQDQVTRYAEQLLASAYRDDGFGAAVLVARGDEVLYRGARGDANLDFDIPLTPGRMFRIGSLTKQFAAAGLLKLVEDGRVGLDHPLSRYLPDYPGGETIRVRELLNHTSGVANYTAIPGYMDGPIRRPISTAGLEVFDDLPVDFAPGAQWKYSNSGYVLIGAVIESVTRKPWHQYLQQSLFAPLGMRHTGYGANPLVALLTVDGYTQVGDRTRPARPLSMTQPHASGALVSTVDDLQTWNRALHEGRVLRDGSYRQMITPTGAAAAAGYGFGLRIDNVEGLDVINHGGSINGFSAMLIYVPGADVSVVVLQNHDGAGQSTGPGDIAAALAMAALTAP
ncbi:serine hydrolase domain-containing protein [Montanilutibacter psychrotolerans]|uniref:Class A beta-lactamase-related serine hydrolase n=1 Tax=Montanilutibacter psychrotolerans TaxID=1327343 RepID=A0A3M8SSI0_9GAMM|nr:serine hydrolase domain-containing protein [Lysobacter psychrotolerans]RNF83655.1 class A beta-lactamase-related serine hydrolase [Lysobacter psychrotolerans]